MLLIANSTPHATITATLLTSVPRYIADQSDVSILVTCIQVSCTQYSCVVFGARHLYKKKLVQETVTDVQVLVQVDLCKILVQVSCLCVTSIRLISQDMQDISQTT